MKLYRLHLHVEMGCSGGFEFFTSRREAERRKRELDAQNDPVDAAEIDEIEITPTKSGILAALNRYADHPDNG